MGLDRRQRRPGLPASLDGARPAARPGARRRAGPLPRPGRRPAPRVAGLGPGHRHVRHRPADPSPEKAKVAETLAEYRGQHKYNLLDDNLRALAAPTVKFQWAPPQANTSPLEGYSSSARSPLMASRAN
ncbi:hypothetical protein Airi01_049900 [Actinoallomurus iriomotensis]|uniref:Uncharacterized protein n=1 Tax=Actinoallomurus iriomotensis TaxID=478107 RepID=A0A9W6RJ98_9ACTN|nr:hypothetical protein Airi01_049900 [Actinoallomurus iriomotensis]